MSTRQPKRTFRERCHGWKERIQVRWEEFSSRSPSPQPPPRPSQSSAQESPKEPTHEAQNQNSSHITQSATIPRETLSFHTTNAEIGSTLSLDPMHLSPPSVAEHQVEGESGPHDGFSAVLPPILPSDAPQAHQPLLQDGAPAPIPTLARTRLPGSS